ncbi:MAG: cupin domain-containing protein [Roseiflexaceae bacterium]|nr:cupin domain-containing protein [Roseiflexaceae bacterium]
MNNPWIQMVPGIHRRTLVSTEQIMQMEVKLEAGGKLPVHAHVQEQVTYVIRGRLRMQVGDQLHELAAGDAVIMGSNVPHGVEVIEDALVVDTFTPPRWDLLEQDRTHDKMTR